MSKYKHYIITAITLGAIGAGSAALISLTNLITEKRIEENKIIKINTGLAKIFPKADEFSEPNMILEDTEYLQNYYEASANDETLGYVFNATGSNMYGKITMLVGIDTNYEIGKIYLVSNEQSYAQTLVDYYVNPYNDKKVNINDVNCGATYGAKLVRDMAQEAQSFAKEFFGA